MNTLHFELKDDDEQVRYTRRNGRYLNTRFMGFHVIHLHRVKDFLVELYFDVRTQSFSGCRLVGDDDLLNLLYDETNQQIKLPFLVLNKHKTMLQSRS